MGAISMLDIDKRMRGSPLHEGCSVTQKQSDVTMENSGHREDGKGGSRFGSGRGGGRGSGLEESGGQQVVPVSCVRNQRKPVEKGRENSNHL